jgi:pilus assembly protein CpaB
MRSKLTILIVAVVLGLLAVFFGARYLESAKADIVAGAEPVVVLVATRDVPAGTPAELLLEQEYAEEREVPRQYVADGAVSRLTSIKGKVVAVPLTRGEQLTSGRFNLAEEVGLAYALPEGYVAISVPDNPARGVSGFISPGDYVMVISSFDPGDLEAAVSKILIKKARVLATGTETSQTVSPEGAQEQSGGLMNNGSAAAGTVQTLTLAVTPIDAERLVFAQEVGSVWYTLLSSSTMTVPDTAGEMFPPVLR